MKPGENSVVRWVIIAFFAIIGLTVYLELQYQQTFATTKNTNHPNRAIPVKLSTLTPASTEMIPKGIQPDDLPDIESRGATVLLLYCAQCHALPPPAMHSAAEWPDVLNRMQVHLINTRNERIKPVVLPPKRDWSILDSYLTRYARTANISRNNETSSSTPP